MKFAQKILIFGIVFLLVINLFFLFENSGITGFFIYNGEEIRAPHDFISKENIIVADDKIILKIENYTLSTYSLSESMVPVFDYGSNGVGIKPKSIEDLHVGDIITFRENDRLITHRIIEKGTDEKGWFCVTKGDRNNLSDGKIRFDNIESILVAVIY